VTVRDEPVGSDIDVIERGVRSNDRNAVARAITLVESTHAAHREQSRELLRRLAPHAGGASRIGITGTPGVGKSSLIEAWGRHLLAGGHRLAVLAIDPSSTVTGGSILGDKTRMTELARHPAAFVRPSPSAGGKGGVGVATREAILICEAAGHDIVIVETVGVGQGEAEVATLVDLFMLLLQPASGDELQGIKRGSLELADLVVVNKADGPLEAAALRMRSEFEAALKLLRPAPTERPPSVLTTSAATGAGLDDLTSAVLDTLSSARQSGALDRRRRLQLVQGMWSAVDRSLGLALRESDEVKAVLPGIEAAVARNELTVGDAAARILAAFRPPDRS
jgi:LAO/AO transport system kinase